MAAGSRPGVCWYCGEERLRLDDGREHIIPASMGGTLTTDRVCQRCNGRAGREIDLPFMRDWLIFMDRSLHVSGKAQLSPRVEATLEDGTPVDLRTDGDGPWRGKIRGEIKRDGDQISIRAGDMDEYRRLLKRVRKQVEAEGRELPNMDDPEDIPITEPVIVRSAVNGVVWLRMAAKITFASLSKVVDERWVATAEAAKYRGWLWDAVPTNEAGSKALGFPVEPREFDRLVNRPPEHLVYFTPFDRETVGLTIAYFGSLFVRARIKLPGFDIPRVAWRTGRTGGTVETSFDQLLIEATMKKVELEGSDKDAGMDTPEHGSPT